MFTTRDAAAGREGLVSGRERIGWARLDHLKTAGVYDEKEDSLALTGEGDMLLVDAGAVVILHPQDAHLPGISVDGLQPVR